MNPINTNPFSEKGSRENWDDEFEFKPLTNGLGFHKKTIELSAELKKTGVISSLTQERNIPQAPPQSKPAIDSESIKKMIDRFPSFDESPFVRPTLPRETIDEQIPFKSPRISPQNFQEDAKAPLKNSAAFVNTINFIEPKLSAAAPIQPTMAHLSKETLLSPTTSALVEVPFSVPAFVFDFFMALALTCLATGIVLGVTQSDLNLVIENAKTDLATSLSLAVLGLSVIQLYVVLSRSVFGKTLGEWAFDLQIGNAQQQKSVWYSILISWRAFLVMFTGFVSLPFLSLILRKDIAGKLSGLRTYRHQ